MAELTYDDAYLLTLEDDQTEVGTEFDPDADYAAPPPPLPDGWHLAKLRNLGAKDAEGTLRPFAGPRKWGNIPATFFTQIEAVIVDQGGPQDGKRTDRYNVTTHAEARQNNASSASLVYRAITGDPIPGVNQGRHMGLIVDQLKGVEPIVWVKTQLEGRPQEAGRAYDDRKKAGQLEPGEKAPKTYRGEKNFMENGKVTGRVTDPETGEVVVGRPVITDMKPQSWTPPGR
jgi:hypothetical protein